jgi:exo-beta-1,3-glucanase (GH17 family)
MSKRTVILILAISLVLALGTSQVLAQNTTYGLNYSPYHVGSQAPGSNIPDSQFISDLTQIAQKFGYIKTYGSDPVLAKIVPLISANNINLKVAVGIYESSADRNVPGTGTTAQIQTAISLAQQYPNIVNMVVVGNECIANEKPSTPTPVSLSTLITDLDTVKAALPNTIVTTCLNYQAGIDLGTTTNSLLSHIDNVMVNVYPFYGGVPISGAFDNLKNAYSLFSGNGKPVWVGETGWPSAGSANGPAIPNVPNEQQFTADVLGKDLPYDGLYLFEAYDEPWKSNEGSIGPYWGLWNSDGTAKFTIGAPPSNAVVPLPGSLLLLGSGLLGLLPFRPAFKPWRSHRPH